MNTGIATARDLKQRPILFSGPMVKAILEDRKTQTRRVMNPQPWTFGDTGELWLGENKLADVLAGRVGACKYMVGDRLWVREAAYIAPPGFSSPADCRHFDDEGRPRVVDYAATMCGDSVRCATDYGVKKTPSIFMPRWASRLVLEIVAVRVERLRDITEEDAKAEGVVPSICPPWDHLSYRSGFSTLWDEINGKKVSWESNPWVWVIEFKRLEVKK